MTRRNQPAQRVPKPLILVKLLGLGLVGLLGAKQIAAIPALAQGAGGQDRSTVPSVITLSPEPPLLQRGDEGDEVRRLQAVLAQLGWYESPINGRYDAATEQAVRSFQRQEGLAVDGITGDATWQQLALNLSPPIVLSQIPTLPIQRLAFTPLIVAKPEPPPSPLWLLLMAMIPLLGGGLTYLHHQYQSHRKY